MRTLLSLSFLAATAIAVPAAAATDCDAGFLPGAAAADIGPIVPGYDVAVDAAPSTPLAELAKDSPWRARFEAAADELLPALRSGDVSLWQPLLGGQWLGKGERDAVAALLGDRCGVFRPLTEAKGPVARTILGWSLPSSYSAAERAEIAARPEAEALVCWAATGAGEAVWPRTAAEADNARDRPYGCARIAYSLRDGAPAWRAFVETPHGSAS